MKKQFVLSFFGLFLLNLSVFGAGPWYVAKEDPNAADTLVEGRGTEALPFRTIQAALDNKAFETGDTVYVKRGVYDEGEKIDSGSWKMTNRVYITKKVYLKAVDGKEVTHIVGRHSNLNAEGFGTDAIRCVSVNGASGTVLEDFTLRDGASYKSGTSLNRQYHFGGAMVVADSAKDVYLVNCTISNCVAMCGGGVRGGTLIRCWIDNCNGTSRGSAFDGSYAFSCLITRCWSTTTTGSGRGVVGGSDLVSRAVNCTFFGNSVRVLLSSDTISAYNCIFANNTTPEIGENAIASECTTTETAPEGKYQVLSPVEDDYRPVSGGMAIGLGKVSNILALKELDVPVPAEYLTKDYLGATIDLTGDTVNAGAIQEVAVPASARIEFDETAIVNGREQPVGLWRWSDKFPVQYSVKPVVPEGKTFYRFDRTKAGTFDGDRQPSSEYANLDGSVRIVPPPADVLAKQKYTAVYAKDEIWVDAAAEDASGTGSSGSPFKTIQDAIDAISQDYTIIRVRPGDYKTGGHVWSNLMTRVDFVTTQSGRPILLRAEEGPAVTAIWGAAGTTVDEELPGCGEGAARCVLGTPTSVVQGFTLRDGHTLAGSEGTTYNTYGAATYQISSNFAQRFRVFDCVITNCVASDTLSYWTHTQRCRFVGNKAAYAVFRRGAHFADLVWNNVCNGDYLVVDSPYLYFCTFAENASSGTKTVGCWANGSHVFNSIFIGGAVTRSTDGVGNVVWTNGSTGSLDEHSKKVDPCLVDVPNGDCRPYCWSPALGWSKDDSTFYYFGGSDCTGGPLVFGSDGGISSGCYQSALPSGAITHYRNGSAVTNKIESGEVLVKRIAPTEASHWWRGETSLYVGEMSVPWTGAGSLREFSASVDGAGTLSVLLNGETIGTVTAADGKKPFSFKPSDTGDTVRFAYSGEGCATLADFKSGAGLMLILR